MAIVESQIVGTVLGGFDGRRGYIYHLAVHNDYQLKNIGEQLMLKCFSAFKELGIEKCHMMVFKNNFGAIAFYEKIGCKLRNDVVVMTKHL